MTQPIKYSIYSKNNRTTNVKKGDANGYDNNILNLVISLNTSD